MLKYTVHGIEVLETPGFENLNSQPVFTRTFQFAKAASGLTLGLADGVDGAATTGVSGAVQLVGGGSLGFAGTALPEDAQFITTADGRLVLKLAQVPANRPFRIALSANPQPNALDAVSTE